MKKIFLCALLALFANANAIIKDGTYEIKSLLDKNTNKVLAGGDRFELIINKDEFSLNTNCYEFFSKFELKNGLIILNELKQNTFMCSKKAKADEEFIASALKEFLSGNSGSLENEKIKINLKDFVIFANVDEKKIAEFKDDLRALANTTNIDLNSGFLLSKGEYLRAIKYKNDFFKAPGEKAWGMVIKKDKFGIFLGCNLIYGKLTQAKNSNRYTNDFTFSKIKSTRLKCENKKPENILKTNLKKLKEQRDGFFSKDLILYFE